MTILRLLAPPLITALALTFSATAGSAEDTRTQLEKTAGIPKDEAGLYPTEVVSQIFFINSDSDDDQGSKRRKIRALTAPYKNG